MRRKLFTCREQMNETVTFTTASGTLRGTNPTAKTSIASASSTTCCQAICCAFVRRAFAALARIWGE